MSARYRCPEPGCDYDVFAVGSQDPEEPDYFAEDIEQHQRGHLPDLQAIGAETIAEYAPDSTERTADDDAGNPDMWFSTTTPLIGPEDLGEDVPEDRDDLVTQRRTYPPAAVEVPRQHRAVPVSDLRPRWSHAGVMSVVVA